MTWAERPRNCDPVQEPIGFKEWQVVCEALASGRQTILLRKGGIHEGRAGFSFAHEAFFLFPTRFHAAPEHVREGEVRPQPEWQPGDIIRITHQVQSRWAVTLTAWEKVIALEPHHIYSGQTVRERFDWQGKGMATGSIHAALVEVRALAAPWEFPYEARFGGCRSWVNLPEPPADWRTTAKPVVNPADFELLDAKIRTLLGEERF